MRELPHHSSHLLVRFCGCRTIVAGHSTSLPPPASLHYVLSVDTCSASKLVSAAMLVQKRPSGAFPRTVERHPRGAVASL